MDNKLFSMVFLFVCFDLLVLDIAIIIIYKIIIEVKEEKNLKNETSGSIENKIIIKTNRLTFRDMIEKIKNFHLKKKEDKNLFNTYTPINDPNYVKKAFNEDSKTIDNVDK